MVKPTNTWKNILSQIFLSKHPRDERLLKRIMHSQGKFKFNIHDIKDKSKYARKFYNTNYILKERIFVPLVMIADKLFGRHKIEKIPDSPQNYLLRRLDNGIERGIRNWYKYFLKAGRYNNYPKRHISRIINKDITVRFLRSVKTWFFTILLMDQAYKELVNCVLLETAQELQKEFEGKDAKHLFYTSRIVNDVNYLTMLKQVRDVIVKHKKGEK